MSDNPRPSFWLKAEHVIAAVPAVVTMVALTVWLVTGRVNADATSAAMVTVNARLDRLFTKLDDISQVLPVLSEKMRATEAQLAEGRGSWNSVAERLRIDEANIAAIHADSDAIRPNPRHLAQ